MTQFPKRDDDLPDNLREILPLAGNQDNGVPKGLTRCFVCGDWIGRCLWPNPLTWHQGATRISCRCEANLCDECGEPIYENRLGSNIYVDATERILHVPGMIGALHRCGQPRIELPCPIQPFWDEKYSPFLTGFPVELVYIGVRPRKDESGKPIVVKARYRFDPGTFVETSSMKQMRYVSSLSSDYFVDVHQQKPKSWRTYKGVGSQLLYSAAGDDFEVVMRETLAVGLAPDEPAR